jgi:hypothetical protein
MGCAEGGVTIRPSAGAPPAKDRTGVLYAPRGWDSIRPDPDRGAFDEERSMEELNQVAGEGLCRDNSLYPAVFGSLLAMAIAFVLALCLGYF